MYGTIYLYRFTKEFWFTWRNTYGDILACLCRSCASGYDDVADWQAECVNCRCDICGASEEEVARRDYETR